VREEFDCKPGYDAEGEPLIGAWGPNDKNDFFR
jgi:hypothetical protein